MFQFPMGNFKEVVKRLEVVKIMIASAISNWTDLRNWPTARARFISNVGTSLNLLNAPKDNRATTSAILIRSTFPYNVVKMREMFPRIKYA